MTSLVRPRHPVGLASLPNELLLEIAELVLTAKESKYHDVCLRGDCGNARHADAPFRHASALVQVNRRFYHLLADWILQKAVSPRQSLLYQLRPPRRYIAYPTTRRRSILHWAVSHGDTQLLKKVLSYGGSQIINHIDDYDATPLFTAVVNGDATMVSLLLKGAADTEVRCMYALGFRTLSLLACSILCGYTEISRLLLQNGADPNGKIDRNCAISNLHLATAIGDNVVLRMLIEAGAVQQGWNGYYPIEVAASLDNDETLAILQETQFQVGPDVLNTKTDVVDAFKEKIILSMQKTINILKSLVRNHKAITNDRCSRCRRLGLN